MTEKIQSLVLLHGWGMSADCWQPLMPLLESQFEVSCISLPGYDGIAEAQSLEQTIALLRQQVSAPACWVGWSLGGMWAMEMASRVPELVSELVLIGSNPSFCKRDDWEHALLAENLLRFREGLETSRSKTLQQFIALQFMDVAGGRQLAKQLMSRCDVSAVSQSALQSGLDQLQEMDVRDALPRLSVPVLGIFGAADQLVPQAAASAMEKINPKIRTAVIKEAGHAPFISHPQEIADMIAQFLNQSPAVSHA